MTNVFISYAWDNDEDHKKWVRHLADSLIHYGINAVIDQYDLELGDRLPHFMEKITDSDYVLIICTPTYKKKSDTRSGGVGYEGDIISGELFTNKNERKFIPVIREGDFQTAIPNSLTGKLAVDLREGSSYESNFNDLIATLQGKRRKPIAQSQSNSNIPAQSENHDTSDADPIRILGIIVDQVTLPRMDGTLGSALYKVPFRLSKQPSALWRKIFLENWDSPPRWTTMHRPGIASIVNDTIILNGTTIEEVRDYHRETLKLCVDEANKGEVLILSEQKKKGDHMKELKNQHYNQVLKIADDIQFD